MTASAPICAGGAYTVTAAPGDRRIKAVGAVSTTDCGAILRKGWEGATIRAGHSRCWRTP